MKTLLFAISLLILAVSCVHAEGWKLVWSDEFKYEGLPDKTKWDYEEGFVQTREPISMRDRLENARVEHGMLVMESQKEPYTPKNHAPVQYTSASLITRNKASFQYGRIEVRAKLPQGKGVWPAIWTLGSNIRQVRWPACGEIDLMESSGKEPDAVRGRAASISRSMGSTRWTAVSWKRLSRMMASTLTR